MKISSSTYSKYNTLIGWIVFSIAFMVYTLTVEPTASFWDAGEYISTSAKLQVGHPPGAPLYQMMGAFFAMFSPNNLYIALAVNMMSVVSSAFTILFLFWNTTYLTGHLFGYTHRKSKELTAKNAIAILGSGVLAALSFTFTDSFWFNAVEAEVYAMATLILSLLFYLGTRWQQDLETPKGHRWLLLISFVIGLSFGIHFMGLLTIPAIGFLYFFKTQKEINIKKFIIANISVVGILMFIFKLLLPSTLTLFGKVEVFFVNTLRLPFNSGTLFMGATLVILFYFLLQWTTKKNYILLNTLVLCILFILIGFSSWIMLPIRANAGTVINENNPNNARELLAYYNREQYQETHLFYGPQFTEIYGGLDPITPYKDDKPKFEKDLKNNKYVIVNQYKNTKQNFEEAHKAFLPRMWSSEHAENYLKFTGPLKFEVKPEYQNDPELQAVLKRFIEDYNTGRIDMKQYADFLNKLSGEYITIEKPSFLANINYMLEYQFGYMYWRYFMWNFTGRQNDNQGQYTNFDGNWISGIPFIDSIRLGNQEHLNPDALNNKARNTYYFIPLLLGIIGVFFHSKKDIENFWVLLLFFVFTGLALKFYLNERPFEPRERDYALVGSFYVFCIWIGLGGAAIYNKYQQFFKKKGAVIGLFAFLFTACPMLLASENWDDHDRSNRYTAQSMAKMYLSSCDENAILFTIGDNDTFALWYAQDIENYRTDVRTLNTSLFATDWYIDQMKKAAYKSAPIPSQLTHSFYKWGSNDAVFGQVVTSDTLDIKTWMNFVQSDDKRTKVELQNNVWVNTYPSKHIKIPVDKKVVLENGLVDSKDADLIEDFVYLTIGDDILYKNRLLMLDLLANNNWERPLYFTGGSFSDADYLWLKDYLQVEGLTYKLVPIKTPVDPNNPFDMGRVNANKLYKNVINWEWGNSERPDIYHDPETRKNAITYRSTLARLFEELFKEGKKEKAKAVLDLGMEKLPMDYYGYYTLIEPFIEGYYKLEEKEKARKLWNKLALKYQERILYLASLDTKRKLQNSDEVISQVERYRNIVKTLVSYESETYVMKKAREFNEYLLLFENLYSPEEVLQTDQENIDKTKEVTPNKDTLNSSTENS